MLELLKVSVSKHAVIETDLGDDLLAVRANAAQLRQIVMNLVTNASEALGDRDGVIRVTTSFVMAGLGSPGAVSGRVADSDYLQLEVSDTGDVAGGSSQDVRPVLHHQIRWARAWACGSAGIVRGLQGVMYLEGELGKGTTFRVLLPCAETTPAEIHDLRPSPDKLTHPLEGVTALVEEDEAWLREPVATMLRKRGFGVLEAADGFSAIDLLRAKGNQIDVILLDISIPGPSSREIVAEAAKTRPDVRVILTSAYSQEMIADAVEAPQISSLFGNHMNSEISCRRFGMLFPRKTDGVRGQVRSH